MITHVIISIGGPSGAGKTAVVKRMKEMLPGKVMTYPAFTTRPKRQTEQEGVDYYFRTPEELRLARQDPSCTNFVEARGYWYWTNLDKTKETVRRHPDSIHVFFISQRKDYELRKTLFPELRWVWLYAEPHEIRARLTSRGNENIGASLSYNNKLGEQQIDDLIDVRIHNREGRLDLTVRQILAFCDSLRRGTD